MRGDHIVANLGGYEHHGIDCGDGTVIHYTRARHPGTAPVVRHTPFSSFAPRNAVIRRVGYARCLDPDSTLHYARSRLGEDRYNLFLNNCEHFARWCKTGVAASDQVNRAAGAAATAGTAAAGSRAALAVVGGAGAVAGLSGAGTMSGLATVGATVGGGAVAGVGVLAAGPALGAQALVHRTYRHDPHLGDDENRARAAARRTGAVTTVAAPVAMVGAISAAGVPGLSAAGITSGLAAVGSTVGGGMAAGVAVSVLAPAAAVGLLAYGAYRLFKG